MPFRETPEEWAERTGKRGLSPEVLDLLDFPVHDYYGTRITLLDEFVARAAELLLNKLPEQGKEVEFMGNWWIEGNPYKGINVVVVDHENHLKAELQLHTQESARVAKVNHQDYEIARDREQPLDWRQAAFDRMVDRFSTVVHPPGIEGIGTPVRASRPVYQPVPIDPRQAIVAQATELAEQMGARVEVIHPEYPAKLRYLLDRGRDDMSLHRYRTALREFDRLIAEFGDDTALWSKRGVANAVVNSGIVLQRLGRPKEALERFDRVINRAAGDRDIWQEASYAERFKREAIDEAGAERT